VEKQPEVSENTSAPAPASAPALHTTAIPIAEPATAAPAQVFHPVVAVHEEPAASVIPVVELDKRPVAAPIVSTAAPVVHAAHPVPDAPPITPDSYSAQVAEAEAAAVSLVIEDETS
jgi:hypothetical protein